jgi:ribosomal protein S6-L-glutamate ligase RimK-like protein
VDFERTAITPELRPFVKGSSVVPRLLEPPPTLSCSDTQVAVCAAPDDATANAIIAAASIAQISINVIDATSIHSVVQLYRSLPMWARRRLPPGIFLRLPGTEDEVLAAALALLDDAMLLYPGPVVNRFSALCSNYSKPWHIAKIASGVADATVPGSSILWRSPRRSIERHEEQVVKSLSSIRSLVVAASDQRLGGICDSGGPVFMQSRLQGRNVRVHVVGEKVVAVMIDSVQEIDYRYSETITGYSCSLPRAVERMCVSLAKTEGLALAGIDLLLTGEGRWSVFEVNPSPAFSIFESMLKSPCISTLVLQYLTSDESEGTNVG